MSSGTESVARALLGAPGDSDWGWLMFKRILVATDGSVHSRRAALTAADLARALEASLTLLAVYQVPPGFEGEPDYSRDLEAALVVGRGVDRGAHVVGHAGAEELLRQADT